MDTNFEGIKNKIIEELSKRIGNLKCPFCTKQEFVLGGGFFAHDLQPNLTSRQMGGVNIPAIPVICKNCGYLAEFAAGTLGLLPQPNAGESKEKNA